MGVGRREGGSGVVEVVFAGECTQSTCAVVSRLGKEEEGLDHGYLWVVLSRCD